MIPLFGIYLSQQFKWGTGPCEHYLYLKFMSLKILNLRSTF
uniref:Uncharacterized protein n=1 Tax=Medicago truncatula TaxID=3880 RepID=I3S6P9_MEDTR|nr:unknown [Medicago truncatula]